MIPVVLNSTQLNPPLYSTQLKVIRWGPALDDFGEKQGKLCEGYPVHHKTVPKSFPHPKPEGPGVPAPSLILTLCFSFSSVLSVARSMMRS